MKSLDGRKMTQFYMAKPSKEIQRKQGERNVLAAYTAGKVPIPGTISYPMDEKKTHNLVDEHRM
jgi:hypothetical protein